MKTLLLICLLIGSNANAQLLSSLSFARHWALGEIPVADSVDYNTINLKLTAAATSFKKIGITKVRVLTAQIFTQYPEKFVRTEDGATKSMSQTGYTAMTLTFLRGLDSAMVKDNIARSIQTNLTDSDKPRFQTDIDKLLTLIVNEGSFQYNSVVTFIAYKNFISYQSTTGVVTTIESINTDLIEKLYGMFLSTPIDNDAFNFKRQLLQDPEITFGN